MSDESARYNTYFRKLLNVHSLFRWEIPIFDENLHEEDLYRASNFFTVIFQLLEVYRAYDKRDFETALNKINETENYVKHIYNIRDPFFISIRTALNHVIYISKATVMLHSSKGEQSFEILDIMTPYSDLNTKEKAAILAIRSACCSMYSYKGTQDALDFIDRAIRKDPETLFWRFLKGMYLYKLRTVLNPVDPPSLEERELFKKVCGESDDPLFMIYLADVYRESANANKNRKELSFWYIPKESGNSLMKEAETMYKESKALYEKAYQMRPRCPVITFRCANGLMKLPESYNNVKLAKKIINDLIEDYENSGYGNTVSAHYYYRFGEKLDLAKKHLKKAMALNVFSAHLNFIKLSYNENAQNFNFDNLQKMLNTFQEAPKKKIIFSQIISYHLFHKRDLKSVCENLIKYLKEGGQRNSLEHHRSCFIETNEAINLLEVVADEVMFTVGNRSLEKDRREFFDKFIHQMNFYNICIWNGAPQNLRRLILDGKIPDTKSRCLLQRNPNQNTKKFTNNRPKPNLDKAKYMKNFSVRQPPTKLSKPQTRISLKEKKPTLLESDVRMKEKKIGKYEVSSSEVNAIKYHRGNRNDDKYRSGRRYTSRDRHLGRRKLSSVSDSSDYSDRSRRRSRKHHGRRKYSESSSYDDSYDRRYCSPSRSRRHHNERRSEHNKSHKEHENRRHRPCSSTSSDSIHLKRKGRKYEKVNRSHIRRRSYSSSSDTESSNYEAFEYEKETSRHRVGEVSPNVYRDQSIKKSQEVERKLTKKMNDISLDSKTQSTSDRVRKQGYDRSKGDTQFDFRNIKDQEGDTGNKKSEKYNRNK